MEDIYNPKPRRGLGRLLVNCLSFVFVLASLISASGIAAVFANPGLIEVIDPFLPGPDLEAAPTVPPTLGFPTSTNTPEIQLPPTWTPTATVTSTPSPTASPTPEPTATDTPVPAACPPPGAAGARHARPRHANGGGDDRGAVRRAAGKQRAGGEFRQRLGLCLAGCRRTGLRQESQPAGGHHGSRRRAARRRTGQSGLGHREQPAHRSGRLHDQPIRPPDRIERNDVDPAQGHGPAETVRPGLLQHVGGLRREPGLHQLERASLTILRIDENP